MATRIVTTAAGGVTKVEVIATSQKGSDKGSFIFPLSYSNPADLWYGDIKMEDPGAYDLKIRSDDGTGATSLRPANPFSVAAPGIIADAKTGRPVEGARVSIYQFFAEENRFVLWPGEIYTQANPQVTDNDGVYRFILPPGRYYLKAGRYGYQTLYTDITEFKSHGILALSLPIRERPHIKIGKRKLYFPMFPDFFGSKRAKAIPVESASQSYELASLINKPAPVFDLPDVKGESVDLRYLRGKRTVLTVWSTWSPLAQAQVPVIDEVQRILSNKDKLIEEIRNLLGNESKTLEEIRNIGAEVVDTKFILISLQESRGVVDAYIRRGSYALTALVDAEGGFADQYPVLTLPQHFFIDRNGIIRDIFVGFLDKEMFLEKVRQL